MPQASLSLIGVRSRAGCARQISPSAPQAIQKLPSWLSELIIHVGYGDTGREGVRKQEESCIPPVSIGEVSMIPDADGAI